MGWILGFCAMASLGLPGLAGFWGEFPAILSTFNPGGDLSQPLFRTYMVDRRGRHRARRGLPALDVAEGRVRRAEARVRATRTSTTCRRSSGRRGCRSSLLIVALGIFPNIIFHVTDDAVTADRGTVRTDDDRRSPIASARTPT